MTAKPFRDRWRDRFQVEFAVSWTLMPRRDCTWRQWLFDPDWGLTVVGQKFMPMTNGRAQLPDGFALHTMVDQVDDGKGKDPATGLKNWWFESRVFWLRGAIRVLGLDIGAGVYWRRRYDPAARDSGSKPDRAETAKTGSVHESHGAATAAIAQPQSPPVSMFAGKKG